MNTTRKHVGLVIPPRGLMEAAKPHDWYEKMRQTTPVAFDPDRNCWDVFLYDDVQKVLSDYKLFSSKRGGEERRPSLINLDPPHHMRYRSLVSQAFTPKAMEELAPRITEITRELFAAIGDRREIDVVADLSYPLPVIVIAEMLGVPHQDRGQFKRWSDVVVAGIEGQSREELQTLFQLKDQVMRELDAYFTDVIEARRKETVPGKDLITALLHAQIDEQHLSLPELLSFCFLLLVAGNETTTNLIGNATLAFTEHPAAYERLRNRPELLPGAIEEVLRYYSPVASMSRITNEEVVLGGQTIPAGSEVIAWIGSANRDEHKFADADQFLIERSSNQHLAFGHGIHFCLGAPLARLEARIALTAMLERMPTLQRVEETPLKAITSPLVYGFKSMPVRF